MTKQNIMEETELTEYTKRELKRTRATPKSKYVSNDELRKKLLQ